MSDSPPPAPLENDSRNPCVGCGPQNPVGLRLTFVREGEGVASTFSPSPEYQGWPGRLHSGVLYLALLETANWTVFALRNRVGLPTRTSALESTRWVSIQESLHLTGVGTPSEGPGLRIRAEARDGAGRHVAGLEREYAFPIRSEFLRRMGYETLPPELDGLVPE